MAVRAERIRNRRDELDTTNGAVAAELGRSPRYVENIMCGADQPSRRVIYGLARVLKMEPEEIDPEINAGKRTPKGDPSEPPEQPPNEPSRPPNRQDHEGEKKGPPRLVERVA